MLYGKYVLHTMGHKLFSLNKYEVEGGFGFSPSMSQLYDVLRTIERTSDFNEMVLALSQWELSYAYNPT